MKLERTADKSVGLEDAQDDVEQPEEEKEERGEEEEEEEVEEKEEEEDEEEQEDEEKRTGKLEISMRGVNGSLALFLFSLTIPLYISSVSASAFLISVSFQFSSGFYIFL